jgi:sigma-B regulation protein RsbU (phosphoserine phosphatase)
MFATAIYGVIDTESGQVGFSRAGHPMPILLPSGAAPPSEPTDGGGGLLGVFPNEIYPTAAVQLQPGDRLFFYSDGVDAIFGDDPNGPGAAWQRDLLGKGNIPTDQILGDFAHRMDNLAGSIEPKDDLTIITVEFEGMEMKREDVKT